MGPNGRMNIRGWQVGNCQTYLCIKLGKFYATELLDVMR